MNQPTESIIIGFPLGRKAEVSFEPHGIFLDITEYKGENNVISTTGLRLTIDGCKQLELALKAARLKMEKQKN